MRGTLLKKILHKLEDKHLILLKFLTELPIQQLGKILPTDNFGDKKQIEVYTTDEVKEKKIHIENAGLCLIAVYFPMLLKQLKYLENGKFKNREVALRSIFILQYIVFGEVKKVEYLLQLNKLLCSVLIEEPINMKINLTKKEKLEANNLIASVIQNWRTLKNTSTNGFRESFLQRKGILSESDNSWTLTIEKRGYDILLESVPWNYNIIKLPWMKKINTSGMVSGIFA